MGKLTKYLWLILNLLPLRPLRVDSKVWVQGIGQRQAGIQIQDQPIVRRPVQTQSQSSGGPIYLKGHNSSTLYPLSPPAYLSWWSLGIAWLERRSTQHMSTVSHNTNQMQPGPELYGPGSRKRNEYFIHPPADKIGTYLMGEESKKICLHALSPTLTSGPVSLLPLADFYIEYKGL
jgi:hypothetical protein